MKFTMLIVISFLVAMFVAGCQEAPVQPLSTATAIDDAAAIGMIEAEILASSRDNAAGNRNFIGVLSGREQVPPNESHGRGVAKFKVAKDGLTISYKLIVANISNVVGADIQLGPTGENGPVVFGLYADTAGGGRICGPIAQGSFAPSDLVGPYAGSTDFRMFLTDLHADSLYVNVRTDDGVDSTDAGRGDFPGGEIRGQLKGHRPYDGHDDHDGRGGKDDKGRNHDGNRNDDNGNHNGRGK